MVMAMLMERGTPHRHPHALNPRLRLPRHNYSWCAWPHPAVPLMAQLHEVVFTLRVHHRLLLLPRSHASSQLHSQRFLLVSKLPCNLLYLQLLLFYLGSPPAHAFSLSAVRMPRQRGKPRRDSTWKPSRPLAPSPNSPGSSSSHSSLSQSGQGPCDLPVPSSPSVTQLEWLALSDNSLGFHLGPSFDLASSSVPPLTVPPNSPVSAPSLQENSFIRPHLGAIPILQGPQPEPHSFSNSVLDSRLQDSLTILHGLVFELRQGLDDLQF